MNTRSKLNVVAVGTAVVLGGILLAGCGNNSTGNTPVGPGVGSGKFILTLKTEPAGSAEFSLFNGTTTTTSSGGTVTVDSGDITVTVKPKSPKYKFIEWSGASTAIDTVVTIKMDGAKTLTAKFETLYKITTTVSPDSGGTISFQWGYGYYPADTSVRIIANANDGYIHTGWEGDTTLGPDQYFRYTVNAKDVEFIATFRKLYVPQFTAEPEDGGYVTLEPAKNDYDNGDEVTATAVANPGFDFVGWKKTANDTQVSDFSYSYTFTVDHDANTWIPVFEKL